MKLHPGYTLDGYGRISIFEPWCRAEFTASTAQCSGRLNNRASSTPPPPPPSYLFTSVFCLQEEGPALHKRLCAFQTPLPPSPTPPPSHPGGEEGKRWPVIPPAFCIFHTSITSPNQPTITKTQSSLTPHPTPLRLYVHIYAEMQLNFHGPIWHMLCFNYIVFETILL